MGVPGASVARISATRTAKFMEWPAPPSRRGSLVGGSNGGTDMKIAVLGIDLGKNVCSVVGLDASGAVVLRRRVRRDTLIDLVAKLPVCIVGMEAVAAPITLLDCSQLWDTTSD